MLRIAAAAIAMAFALTALGPAPADAAIAWKYLGTYKTRTVTKTFYDRSPVKTLVAFDLQKKAGGKRCVAKVTVKRKNWSVSRFGPMYKYARTYGKRYFLRTTWNGSSKRPAKIKVTVTTNGACIYRLWAR